MEAIQIDAPISSAEFPFFGPYDNTPCLTIGVVNSRFESVGTGVGTHSDPASAHQDIKITDCTFNDCYFDAIRGQGWSGVKVIGNRISGGYQGIIAFPAAAFAISDWAIIGNTVYNVGTSAYSGTIGRPIGLSSIGSTYVQKSVVAGNTVQSCTGSCQHGIYVNGTQKFSVVNNIVDSVNGNGIYCDGASYGSVIGNHSTLAATSSFAIANSSTDIVLAHNRGATASITGSSRCIYKDNILATSSTVSTMTSSLTTPNLVNGTSV